MFTVVRLRLQYCGGVVVWWCNGFVPVGGYLEPRKASCQRPILSFPHWTAREARTRCPVSFRCNSYFEASASFLRNLQMKTSIIFRPGSSLSS